MVLATTFFFFPVLSVLFFFLYVRLRISSVAIKQGNVNSQRGGTSHFHVFSPSEGFEQVLFRPPRRSKLCKELAFLYFARSRNVGFSLFFGGPKNRFPLSGIGVG